MGYTRKLTSRDRKEAAIQASIENSLKTEKDKTRVSIDGEGGKKVTKYWNRIERALKQNGYLPSAEDGYFWLTLIKTNKLHLSKTGLFEYDETYIWIGYEDEIVSVGLDGEDEEIFSCEISDVKEELPTFLSVYFRSRLQNGLIKKYL